jgi:single-stranded-DNA-specific exonuclease
VGINDAHLILIVEDPGGDRHRVIWWQGEPSQLPEGRFDMAYTVRASNFNGQNRVQIEWVSKRLVEDNIKVSSPCSSIEVIDYRQVSQPQNKIKEILGNSPLVFSEGEKPAPGVGVDRYHIQPASELVIWSLPCGREELSQIISLSTPNKIYLFANDPGSRELHAFLSRLGGLLRMAINQHQGWVDLNSLIKATAQKKITVLKGIDCYISHGDICQKSKDGNQIQFARPGLANSNHHDLIMDDLSKLMTETEAYRSFYLRADPHYVIS